MPIYVYKCPTCGWTKEAIQLAADAPTPMCESCHWMTSTGRKIPTPMERVPTAAAFSVNGFNAKNGYSK